MALMTVAEVVDITLPTKNLDTALLDNSLPLAELKYIKKALGKDLYDQLMAEKTAGQYTGLNQVLVETYIKPCLARYVVYEALPMIKVDVTSNGLQTLKTDFTIQASDADMGILRNKMLSDAELYLYEMMEYLRINLTFFPKFLYTEEVSGRSLPYLY